MRVIALIQDESVIRRILAHLGKYNSSLLGPGPPAGEVSREPTRLDLNGGLRNESIHACDIKCVGSAVTGFPGGFSAGSGSTQISILLDEQITLIWNFYLVPLTGTS